MKTNTEISISFWFSLFYSIPSLSPYRMTDWKTDGVTEKQIHSLCVGWRNLPTLRVGWRKYRNLCLFLINTLLLYPSLSPYAQTHRQRNDNTRFAWAGGTCPRFAWAGRILKFFLGFQIPPIFCKCISTSKRILNFFLGFQIPPIFCINHLVHT